MKALARITVFPALLGLALLGESAQADPIATEDVVLAPGEEYAFFFRADTPMRVGFGFELGTAEGRSERTCFTRKTRKPELVLCGMVVQMNPDGTYSNTYISSLHGGAITMKPTDGKIHARLVSYASVKMKFIIEIEEDK